METEKKKKKEIKVTVFWDVTMCKLVHRKRRQKTKCAYSTTVYSTDIMCITKQQFLIRDMSCK